MIIQELIIVSLFAFEIFNLKVLRNGTSYNQLDIIGKGVKKWVLSEFFKTWLEAFKHGILKNVTLSFRSSAVSLKRRFSLLQKKRNSSITEGYRNKFISCLEIFGPLKSTAMVLRVPSNTCAASWLQCLSLTERRAAPRGLLR